MGNDQQVQVIEGEVTMMNNKEVKNGTPHFHRNNHYELDTYEWPDGRWVRIHDDGRMTVGRAEHGAEVIKRRHFGGGSPQGGQVVVGFPEIPS
jgi:hypothetical protein